MAKVDLASGEIEKEINTNCEKCVHLENCEIGQKMYCKTIYAHCRNFEEAESEEKQNEFTH